MGFIKKEKRNFDYKPLYYKGEGSPYELKHRFDEFRTSVGEKKNLKGKFNVAINEFKASENGGFNKTIIIIIAVLVLGFLFLIDFDISIFLPLNN
ncbi:MAG: riboflavin synthase subunit beta [Flavobacteriales bacterium]|nr:MAG: riboflavin synthase subunit beta [Flavobacteriales bacterium]